MTICNILQSSGDVEKYFNVFFDFYNPIFIALFLLIILIVLLYISIRYIYNPLIRKHRDEKEDLELQSAKLLASFSELDPNPIIRIDTEGKIIGQNKSASEKLLINSKGSNISDIYKQIDFDVEQSILDNKSLVLTHKINDRTYDINFHGISFLQMAQLYFLDVTEKKEYDEQMNMYQKLLRDSSLHLQKALEDEKNRFAGLLHDSLGQTLLFIKMNLQNNKKLITSKSGMEEYSRTIDLLDSCITEVKETARSLRPLNLEQLGLVTALNAMCNTVIKECKIKAELNLPSNKIVLNKDLEVCVFMVAQEAINNIIKHSRAKEFSLSLSVKNSSATLIISDNGIGFKPNKLVNDRYVSDGLGLLSMQDRVERLNGNFHIDSSHNNGTVIIADFETSEEFYNAEYNYKDSGR